MEFVEIEGRPDGGWIVHDTRPFIKLRLLTRYGAHQKDEVAEFVKDEAVQMIAQRIAIAEDDAAHYPAPEPLIPDGPDTEIEMIRSRRLEGRYMANPPHRHTVCYAEAQRAIRDGDAKAVTESTIGKIGSFLKTKLRKPPVEILPTEAELTARRDAANGDALRANEALAAAIAAETAALAATRQEDRARAYLATADVEPTHLRRVQAEIVARDTARAKVDADEAYKRGVTLPKYQAIDRMHAPIVNRKILELESVIAAWQHEREEADADGVLRELLPLPNVGLEHWRAAAQVAGSL